MLGEVREPPPPVTGDVDSRASIASPRLCEVPPRFTFVLRLESARLVEEFERLEVEDPHVEREGEELLDRETTGRETRPEEPPKLPPRPPRASASTAGQASKKAHASRTSSR